MRRSTSRAVLLGLMVGAATLAACSAAVAESPPGAAVVQPLQPKEHVAYVSTVRVELAAPLFVNVRFATGEATPAVRMTSRPTEGFAVKNMKELVTEHRISDRTRFTLQNFMADTTIETAVNHGALDDGSFAFDIVQSLGVDNLRRYVSFHTARHDPTRLRNLVRIAMTNPEAVASRQQRMNAGDVHTE